MVVQNSKRRIIHMLSKYDEKYSVTLVFKCRKKCAYCRILGNNIWKIPLCFIYADIYSTLELIIFFFVYIHIPYENNI